MPTIKQLEFAIEEIKNIEGTDGNQTQYEVALQKFLVQVRGRRHEASTVCQCVLKANSVFIRIRPVGHVKIVLGARHWILRQYTAIVATQSKRERPVRSTNNTEYATLVFLNIFQVPLMSLPHSRN